MTHLQFKKQCSDFIKVLKENKENVAYSDEDSAEEILTKIQIAMENIEIPKLTARFNSLIDGYGELDEIEEGKITSEVTNQNLEPPSDHKVGFDSLAPPKSRYSRPPTPVKNMQSTPPKVQETAKETTKEIAKETSVPKSVKSSRRNRKTSTSGVNVEDNATGCQFDHAEQVYEILKFIPSEAYTKFSKTTLAFAMQVVMSDEFSHKFQEVTAEL